jgi:hypothetical protein
MHEKQHAFRKGHSTELAISEVVNTIESAIHKGKYALATFLDIEGAFDNLQTDSAVKAMKNHQIDSESHKVVWFLPPQQHVIRNIRGTQDAEDAYARDAARRGVITYPMEPCV